MRRILLLLLAGASIFCARPAEPLFLETFDRDTRVAPKEAIVQVEGRGGVVHISVPGGTTNPGRTLALQ